jgi:hypothetical protein
VSLDDGNTYMVSEGVAIEALQPSMETSVSFEDQGARKAAYR